MRLLADTNIAAPAIRSLRQDGHDVVYVGERRADPGDAALLAEALSDRRVLVTKDHDIGALVFKENASHADVLLIDDLGSSDEETSLLHRALAEAGAELARGAFVRAGAWGARIADDRA